MVLYGSVCSIVGERDVIVVVVVVVVVVRRKKGSRKNMNDVTIGVRIFPMSESDDE
jgi:hypothetical protein